MSAKIKSGIRKAKEINETLISLKENLNSSFPNVSILFRSEDDVEEIKLPLGVEMDAVYGIINVLEEVKKELVFDILFLDFENRHKSETVKK